MPEELSRLEYLEVTSPRKLAVLSALRGNLKDLHPKDKFYFLSSLESAIQDLKDTAFIEIGMTEEQRQTADKLQPECSCLDGYYCPGCPGCTGDDNQGPSQSGEKE